MVGSHYLMQPMVKGEWRMKNGDKSKLDELLEQITDENRHEEIDLGIAGDGNCQDQ